MSNKALKGVMTESEYKKRLAEREKFNVPYVPIKQKTKSNTSSAESTNKSNTQSKLKGIMTESEYRKRTGVSKETETRKTDFATNTSNAYSTAKNAVNNKIVSSNDENERKARLDEVNERLENLRIQRQGYTRAHASSAKIAEIDNEIASLTKEAQSLNIAGATTEKEKLDLEYKYAKATANNLRGTLGRNTTPEQLKAYTSALATQRELEDKHKLYGDVEKYSDVVKNDDFLGQTAANYRYAELSREADYAWSNYIDNPTEENKQIAYAYSALAKDYAENNAKALDDENVQASWISKTAAGYMPQFIDQLAPQALGGGIGYLVGGNAGASIGAGLATSVQSYKVISGSIFRTLLENGVDEETALEAAKDEALISGIIEGGETALSFLALGGGKALSAIKKAATGAVAKETAGKATSFIGRMLTHSAAKKAASAVSQPVWKTAGKAAIGYGANIFSERMEEWLQEGVSIANEDRTLNGKTDGRLLSDSAKLWWDAATGKKPEEKAQMDEAAAEGGKIAAMFGGASIVSNTVISHTINKIADTKTIDAIIKDDKRLTALIEDGKASGEGTEAHKIANEIETAKENGKVTREQVKKLTEIKKNEFIDSVIADDEALQSLIDDGKAVGKKSVAYKIAKKIEDSKIDGNLKGEQLIQLSEALAVYYDAGMGIDVTQTSGDTADLRVAIKPYTTMPTQNETAQNEGLEAVTEGGIRSDIDVASEKAVQAAYEAGKTGLEAKDVSLETPEQQEAFFEGKREYVMSNSQKKDTSKGYGENGARAFNDIAKRENQEEIMPKFQRAYELGFMGAENEGFAAKADSIEQRAYEAGKADYAESLRGAIENSKKNVVYSKNGGLVRNEYSKKVNYKELKLMDELGKVLGVKIKYAEQVYGGKANGSYKDGYITLALDAENKLVVVAKHEITHHMKEVSPEEYFAFRNYAVQALSEGRGSTAMTLVEETQAKAKSAGVNLTVEEAMDEIAADFTENLLTNEADLREFLESMSETKQKRNVMQKFFDAIHAFLDKIGKRFNGSRALMDEATQSEFGATVEQFERAERLWKDVIRATAEKVKTADTSTMAQKNTTEKGDVKMALKGDITLQDIKDIQSIGKKSVNQFDSLDIKKTEAFARRYFKEMGVKSPFFRAWFGDWRANDTSLHIPTEIPYGEAVNSSKRNVNNADTNWNITVDDTVVRDSLSHADKDKPYISRLLSQIDTVLERSILLDSAVSEPTSRNKKGSTAFMHYFYSVVEYNGNPFLAKIAVEEYNIDSEKRAYNVERIKMSALSRTQYSTMKASYRGNLVSNADGISVADLFELVKTYDKKFQPKPVNEALLNEDGTPKVFYHGTKANRKFNIFKNETVSIWFSSSKGYANIFSNNSKIYEVYLHLENPCFVGDIGSKIDNDTLTRLSNNSGIEIDLLENIIKQTDAKNIWEITSSEEFAKVLQSRGFDGIEALEGRGVHSFAVFNSTQIKSATDNIGTFDTSNPDIRFSLKNSIEETRDLVAVHNVRTGNISGLLDLGGIPMPSIAIYKSNTGHVDFGDVSFVFKRDTVDPQLNGQNDIFSDDAWTPIFPRIEYKLNDKKVEELYIRAKESAKGTHPFKAADFYLEPSIINDAIGSRGVEVYKDECIDNYAFKQMYLSEIDKPVQVQKSDDAGLFATDPHYLENTKKLIDSKINETEYKKWLDDLFDGIVEKSGIRNGIEAEDKNGNLRSFEDLHDDYDLQTVLEDMMKQPRTRAEEGKLISGAIQEYKSIDEVKANEGRLNDLPYNEYTEIRKNIRKRLRNISKRISIDSENYDYAENLLMKVAFKFDTSKELERYIKNNKNGKIKFSREAFNDFVDLIGEIKNMPVRFFEAKPRRTVDFAEIALAVVPEGTDDGLISRLKEAGVGEVVTYKKGDEQSRITAVNSRQGLKFSLKKNNDSGLKKTNDNGIIDKAKSSIQTKIRYSPNGIKLPDNEMAAFLSAVGTEYYYSYKTHKGLQHQSCVMLDRHFLIVYEDGGFGHYNPVARIDYANVEIANDIVGVLKNGENYEITDVVNEILETYSVRRSGYTLYNTRTKKRSSSRGDGSLLERTRESDSRGIDGSGDGISSISRGNEDGLKFSLKGQRDLLAENERPFKAIDADVERFGKQIDNWFSGNMRSDELFRLGKTPTVLKALGAKNLPIVMSQDVIVKITGGKHSISIDDIKSMPNAIADPIMIFVSDTVPNSFVILTEISDKSGSDVVVAMHLNRGEKHIRINRVASVYGKDNSTSFVTKQIAKGNLRYIDKKKSHSWSQSRGLQLPKLADTTNGSIDIILERADIVNTYFNQFDVQKENGKVKYSLKGLSEVVRNNGTRSLAEWTTKRVGDTVKPKSISEIVATIEHDFGLNTTTGHIKGKNTLGIYIPNNQGIRTKVANDLPTLSHELGHFLDKTYAMQSRLTEGMETELKQNLDKDFASNYKEKELIGEGIAEYVRRFLKNRDDAADDYPLFNDFFLKLFKGKDLARIEQLADDINAYYSLDTDSATSSIRSYEDGPIDLRSPLEKLKDTGSMLYQAFEDSNHSIRLLDKATGGNAYILASNAAYADAIAGQIITGDLTDRNGQYVAKGLGSALRGIDLSGKAILDSNKKPIKDSNGKPLTEYTLFGEYLIVKHGPERLSEGMRVFADDRKNSKEWMNKRQAVLEAEYPQFKEASENLYKFIYQFYKTWGVSTGLISQEALDSWQKRWSFYVPFNRATEKGKGIRAAKRGFANQDSTIKKAKGSGLDIINPVDNVIANVVKMVTAGTRNNVMLHIAAQADILGANATLLEKIPTPMRATKVDMTGVKETLTGWLEDSSLDSDSKDMASGIINNLDDILLQYGRGKAGGNIITVLRNGEPEFWKVNDVQLLKSLTSLSPKTMDGVLDAYAVISRFMTQNITGNNLVWSIFSNLPRDMETFFTYSKNKNIVKMTAGVAEAYLNKFKEENADPFFKEFLAMGGGKISAYTADRNLAKNVKKKMAGIKSKNPLDAIGFISDMIESGPRYATYKMMRESGMSPQESFYEAMDITVNFRRGGTVSRQINKFVPFFNANMQGLDKFFRWITVEEMSGKKGRGKAIAKRTAMYITANAVLGAIVYAINNYDDEAEENYEQLSTYTKNSFWVIPIGDGKYFAIPKPREIGVLSSFFETCMERYIGENEHAFDDFYSYATENFLPAIANDIAQAPVNGVKETGMNIIGSFGLIGVFGYLGANRDFLGRPIVSSGLQNLEPKDQYTDRTSKLAYYIGQATGGSPQEIDFFFQQVLGGWWKVQKALFPIGEKNRDRTLGVANTYIKDNQYSTDLTNWLYDRADTTTKSKNSNPSDIGKAIEAKWDSNMVDFYGRYYKIAKADSKSTAARGTRQLVLDMIKEYQKGIDGGYKTDWQKAVEAVCEDTSSTEYLPSVMKSTITDGDKKKHSLSDVQYVEYQTDYLRLYWETIEDTMTKDMSTEEKIYILSAAKRVAKEKATEATLKRIGATPTVFTTKYDGVDNDDLTVFLAGASEANADGSVKKSEILDVISDIDLDNDDAWTLYLSRYDGNMAKAAREYGVDAKLFMTAVIDMNDITADKDKNGKTISGSRRNKIEKYLGSVCSTYEEYLFLLGTEYDSVKKDADYIAYFGK